MLSRFIILHIAEKIAVWRGTKRYECPVPVTTIGQWAHVAVSWASDGAVRLYKNGQLVHQAVVEGGAFQTPIVGGGVVSLGQEPDSFGGDFNENQAFHGLVDQLRVWKVRRTDAEILAGYNHSLDRGHLHVGEAGVSWRDGCTEAKPCAVCGGDCDHDDECEGSLQCFQRTGHTVVPGCKGIGTTADKSGGDFCYDNGGDDAALFWGWQFNDDSTATTKNAPVFSKTTDHGARGRLPVTPELMT